jgi:hypothetical protein
VFKELKVVSELTRHVGQLSSNQLDALQVACTGYGVAFRALHGAGRIVTPKGHLIETHVMYYARKYGTCGSFGEDGIEAYHPFATAVRIITRPMRNPEQRYRASDTHEVVRDHAPTLSSVEPNFFDDYDPPTLLTRTLLSRSSFLNKKQSQPPRIQF